MENSVYQARWILIPIVSCFFGFVGLAAFTTG
nr:hypothetical protein RNT25_04389 [arsenite-oxidising bacterium NT-25]